jgi:hypothetical protein
MASPSEKFCLKWNDFQTNIVGSISELRRDTDFSDVTLVCEEDQQIEAHRIILTACSPFFSRVLKRNKHSHSMIYMRGLKAKDLKAIVDFIYLGEANIYQEDLDGFLVLAEELQLKGLAGTGNDPIDTVEHPKPKPEPQRIERKINAMHQPENYEQTFEVESSNNSIMPVYEGKLAMNSDTEDIKAQIDLMIEVIGEKAYRCTVCGKENRGKDSSRRDLGRHVETHIEGVSHPCSLCGKVSRSSHALQAHVSRSHRK